MRPLREDQGIARRPEIVIRGLSATLLAIGIVVAGVWSVSGASAAGPGPGGEADIPDNPDKDDLRNEQNALAQAEDILSEARGQLQSTRQTLTRIQRNKAQNIFELSEVEGTIEDQRRDLERAAARVEAAGGAVPAEDSDEDIWAIQGDDPSPELVLAMNAYVEAETGLRSAEILRDRLAERAPRLAQREQNLNESVGALRTTIRERQAERNQLRENVEALLKVVDVRYVPTENYSLSSYYMQPGPYWSSGFHTGTDYAAPSGTPIFAADDGTATTVGWGGAYGNWTVLSHSGGVSSRYAHQSSQRVSVGQRVKGGDVIGTVGSTGNSTGPHLHFEVVNSSGGFMDPVAWLES